MSVGLLIITHDRIGERLLDTATSMLEFCPLNAKTIAVHGSQDPDLVQERAREYVDMLDDGDGVLVLADVYGSTPSNIAIRLLRTSRVMVVAGVNLPMLIRVLNYPKLDLGELAQKALSGGRDGILLCKQDPWS